MTLHVALSAHFWGQPTTGSGQYLHRLSETIRREHPDIRLTLVADAAAARRAAPPQGMGWHVATTPFDDRSANMAKLWFEQVALPRAARTLNADLLHVPYFAPPLRAAMPTVATIHDLIPLLLPAYRGGRLVQGYMAVVSRAARRCALILADSDASRRDIVAHLDVAAERVRTVYLAADTIFRPQPAATVAALREKLGLPDRFVLYLGGFDSRKGVDTLLRATSQSSGDWPLVIAGKLPASDSSFAPDPRLLAARLGLGERVRFLGWVEESDKPALLSAATLFVFPSRYEGFGLPVLEAMACGTPTVTTTASSLPELAGDGAVLVPPDDPTALAATLDTLMSDAPRQQALAQRGMAQAAQFSWQRCAAESVAAYYEALDR